MIAAKKLVDSHAGDHTEREAGEDLVVKRDAFRFVRSFLVEIGAYLAFKRISLDSFIVSFVRHLFSPCERLDFVPTRYRRWYRLCPSKLPTPTQLVAQNVEVVSVHWLNEIECRAALSNYNSIRNLKRKTDLTIKRQRHLFLVRLQQQLDLGVVRDDDGTIRECKRTDRSNNYRVHRRKDHWSTG